MCDDDVMDGDNVVGLDAKVDGDDKVVYLSLALSWLANANLAAFS